MKMSKRSWLSSLLYSSVRRTHSTVAVQKGCTAAGRLAKILDSTQDRNSSPLLQCRFKENFEAHVWYNWQKRKSKGGRQRKRENEAQYARPTLIKRELVVLHTTISLFFERSHIQGWRSLPNIYLLFQFSFSS